MNLLDSLDKNSVREFFSKGWITHDAMWYYNCLQELGPEQANRLNRNAVAGMAAVEIQRIQKLMGREKKPLRSFGELQEIIETAFQLIKPDFMKLYYSFPEKNVFRGGFHECFAYEGVKRFGMGGVYQCGITMRLRGWFDALGVRYEVIPEYDGCLMRDRGKCEADYRFSLE